MEGDKTGPRGVSVLIVEGDARVRSALARLVRGEEMTVTTLRTPSGSEARSKLDKGPHPDVALISVDHDPPGSLRLIGELAARGVRVVALGVNDGFHREALAAGAVVFIEKDDQVATIVPRLIASMKP